MRNYEQPPRPHGATGREIQVLAEAHRVACLMTDQGAAAPLRNALELIVDLIEERAKIRTFGQDWERATQCDD